MVSIIMPAYNAETTIKDSIDSVINQTFIDWELIIINDCSTDSTEDIIKSYLSDNRIKYIKNDENMRVAKSRNKGMKQSRYNYIAFLDSDDLWKPNKLEIQINYMEENGLAFTSTDYELISFEGNKLDKYVKAKNKNYKQLLKGNSIGCLTAVFNKSLIKDLKMPNVGHEDYATWLEILRVNNIMVYPVNKILASHRTGHESLSSNKKRSAKWTWNIFRINENKNIITSIYYMFFYAINSIIKIRKIKER